MSGNIKLEEVRALGFDTIAQAHEHSRWVCEVKLNHAAEVGYQSSSKAAARRAQLSAPESTWIPKNNEAGMQEMNKGLKAVVVYGGKSEEYIDLDVYVRMPDHSEYLQHTYARIANPDEIIRDGVRFSSSPVNDFGEEGVECPAAVTEAFAAATEDVKALIQSHSSENLSGRGWTVELLLKTLEAGGKIEPFNDVYVKVYVRKPTLDPAKNGLNRFIQEGGPDYSAPSLALRTNAENALCQYSGDVPVEDRPVADRPRG